MPDEMSDDPDVQDATGIDDKIAYHVEMEEIAVRAGDFTKAQHHRNMQDIFKALKKRL